MRKRVSDEDKKIGQRIRARRKALGLTQSDLGACIGVTFQQVTKVEQGQNRISAANLAKLAGLLSVPITYFYPANGNTETDEGLAFLGTAPGARIVRALSTVTDKRLRQTIADVVEQIAGASQLAAHPLIRNIDGVTEGLAFNDD